MLDATTDLRPQRLRGSAAVGLDAREGRTRLATLAQSGSAKAMLPRTHGPEPEVVFLNTAGGLTGGDRLSYGLSLAPGARATATTQTAERAYRSPGDAASVRVEIAVGAGASLDWLPQETILFDGASLERQTEIALGAEARLLFVEILVLGRAAMGETVRRLHLRDTRRITRDGAPVFVEPVLLDDARLARGANPAMLNGARAMATLGLIAPGAEDALGPLRALPETPGVTLAASAWDGRLILRAMASDAWPLRRALAAALSHLRGRALPRVWQI